MKFTVAWANVMTENNTLKVGLWILTCCCLIMCITIVKLSLKEPLIIERECLSRSLQPVQNKQTSKEIEEFLKIALPKRFDTDAVDSKVFLSDDEIGFRFKEQEELSRKGMKQRVFVSAARVTEKEIVVDADRILALGNIRSNIPFLLTVQVAATTRTPGNPYGLIIQKISQAKEEEKKP